MSLLKKILAFLKDLITGFFYPGLSIGFMLLVAAALFYFRPQDTFSDSPVLSQDPKSPEMLLAARLLKWGAALALGCGLAIWAVLRIQSWWSKRPKKEAP